MLRRLWSSLTGTMQQETLTASPAVAVSPDDVEVDGPVVRRHGDSYVVSVSYRNRRKARAKMASESRKRNW